MGNGEDDGKDETNCPRCGRPIQGVTSPGPGTHLAYPCGHLVSVAFARSLSYSPIRSDEEE